jgi:hypothetical protein
MMKKAILLLTLASICLFSCSKKEEEQAPATPTNDGGKITYTMLGQTFTTTDFIMVAISNYKFKWVSDKNFTTKVGDQTPIDFVVGATDNNQNATFTPNGISYSCTRMMKVTIDYYDGKTVKGSFTGNVYLNGVTTNPAIPVTGTFESNSL